MSENPEKKEEADPLALIAFTKEDLELKQRPVEIGDESYVLIELDGTGRDAYMNDMGDRVKMVDGKAEGLKTFDNLQAKLLQLTLRRLVDKGVDGIVPEAVSLETIQSWPSRISSSLFDASKTLSGIKDEDDEGKGGKGG